MKKKFDNFIKIVRLELNKQEYSSTYFQEITYST